MERRTRINRTCSSKNNTRIRSGNCSNQGRRRTEFWSITKNFPSQIVWPLCRVVILEEVVHTICFVCMTGDCHVDDVLMEASSRLACLDDVQGLIEFLDIRTKRFTPEIINGLDRTVRISTRIMVIGRGLLNIIVINFFAKSRGSLISSFNAIVGGTHPCDSESFALFRRPSRRHGCCFRCQ